MRSRHDARTYTYRQTSSLSSYGDTRTRSLDACPSSTVKFVEINPRSYVPVYQQLADIMREQIRTGQLTPGTELPGENELAKQHDVGRPAVRQALAVLRAEALIVTVRGEGTRVRVQPERQTLEIGPETRVWFRQPTPAERVDLRIDEGVGLLVVETEGEPTRLLASDEVTIIGAGDQ